MALGDILLGVFVPVGVLMGCALAYLWESRRHTTPAYHTPKQIQILTVINNMRQETPSRNAEEGNELPRYEPRVEVPNYEHIEDAVAETERSVMHIEDGTLPPRYDHIDDFDEQIATPQPAVLYERTRILVLLRFLRSADVRASADVDLERGSGRDGHEAWGGS